MIIYHSCVLIISGTFISVEIDRSAMKGSE